MDNIRKWKWWILGMSVVVLAIGVSIVSWKERTVLQVERNDYGKGDRKEVFEVVVEEELQEEMELHVGEQQYSEEETKQLFERVIQKLEQEILGKNKSLDHVEQDLHLVQSLPGEPVEITWESRKTKIINSLGEIETEELPKEGVIVELQALLSYEEKECLHVIPVRIFPPTLTAKEKLLQKIEQLYLEAEETSREHAKIVLPSKVDGKTIVWKKQKEHTGMLVLFFGGTIACLLWLQEKETEKKARVQRELQMKRDYPELVNQISLLVGAGMTVKNSWKKIVKNYEENHASKEKRFAYEEMAAVLREMQSGVSESECYERFGKRCGVTCYMKLGTLLSQNLRKGTKGLVDALAVEASQAFEERKQNAKRQGEEVSTKLLLPMSLMLIVVLIIVIVPAFLSISL